MKRAFAFVLAILLAFPATVAAGSGQSAMPAVTMTRDSVVPYESDIYWQGDILRYNLHFPSKASEPYAVGLVAADTPIETLYDAQGKIDKNRFLYEGKDSYNNITLDTSNVTPGDYRFVYLCPLAGADRVGFAYYDVLIKPKEAPSAWAAETVKKAANHYLIPEALSNRYTSPITRDHFVLLIDKLVLAKTGLNLVDFAARKNLSVSNNPFKDINHRYFADTSHNYVIAANKLGIISGKQDGLFDPNGLLTRQEAAAILQRTAQALGVDASGKATNYSDNNVIASWAKDGVNYVSAKGIMSGVGDNRFDPQGTYTYQQAYVTVYPMLTSMSGETAQSDAQKPTDDAPQAMATPFTAAGHEFTIKSAGVNNDLRGSARGIKGDEVLFTVTFVEGNPDKLSYNDLLSVYRQAYVQDAQGNKYYSSYEDSWDIYVDRVVGFSIPANVDTASLIFVIAGQSRRLQ